MTTHNLERVRRIKSRMVRLKTRGETIKEVLEKYLDDDSDMKDMNLTAKCARTQEQRLVDSAASQNISEALDDLGPAAAVSFALLPWWWHDAVVSVCFSRHSKPSKIPTCFLCHGSGRRTRCSARHRCSGGRWTWVAPPAATRATAAGTRTAARRPLQQVPFCANVSIAFQKGVWWLCLAVVW